ncbi:MAG: hypothetical protein HC834_10555 [Rhodospirillales bacterium]|nr:hypothetical protein [Rhodospirillales bacterium]
MLLRPLHYKCTAVLVQLRRSPATSRRPRHRQSFSIAPAGGCNWVTSFDQMATIQLPDGLWVEGNEIRFAEDVDGPGHYP